MPANAVTRLASRLADAAGAPVELERPNDPAHGDFATNAALRLAPRQRRPPRELAGELAERARALDVVERAEVAGPGFVNLWLRPAWYEEALAEILESGEAYGSGSAETAERVQVEHTSANPTGPLTVASARNAAYGDSVARLLAFAGHTVEREFYVNDVGTQIDRFHASVAAIRRGDEPPEDGYRGDYMRDVAAQERPVDFLLERIAATLARFRVGYDSWLRQSSLQPEIAPVIEALETYEHEGALWVRTSPYGDEKDRVIVRSAERGGQPAYVAWDAAYLLHKLRRGFDRLLYVLGADHHGYVGRLKGLAGALGYEPARVEVLVYQLVQLVEGGRTRRMAKRSGDVVFLDDLMDAIGVDAARWYLVSRGHDQPIELDVELAAERTQKNPVYYVQYAHARIAGILRNDAGAPVSASAASAPSSEERELVKRLADFPGVVAEATERRAPHALPIYAIRVADDFHRFYHDHRVLGSESEAFRLALCRGTQIVLARCLDLIGVEAPERM